MKISSLLGAVGVVVMLSSACSSSGSGGGTGGGAAFDCAGGCQKIVGAQCPNDTQQSCEQECNADLAQSGACAGSYKTFLSCAIELPLHCGADGKATIDESGVMSSCLSQVVGYSKCIACMAATGDSACDTCVKQSCCNQLQAVYDDPNFGAYTQCYNACADATCQNNCKSQYPTVVDKGTAVSTCSSTNCASACGP